jgi:arylformamidase
VGALESSEFLRQSRIIAQAWGKAGVATRYEAVPQTNHFTVLDALTDARSPMVERLAALARG